MLENGWLSGHLSAGRIVVKPRIGIVGLLLACTAIAGPAGAFERQNVAPLPAPKIKQHNAETTDGKAEPGPDLGVKGGTGGKGLKIPGFGSLGFLPNVDIGLELLYGGTPADNVDDTAGADDLDSDVAIKGRYRKRF